MISVLAASLVIMLASFSGKFIVWKQAGPIVERNLHFLVSFAAGVLLVVLYGLAMEIVELAGSLSAGLPWIVIGAVAVLIAFRFLPQFHHHHESRGDHTHSKIDANRILLSDGIHNISDGVVIVASFAASPFLGIISTVSILVHEVLQEISEFFVLKEAGLPTNKALFYNFLTSATILIGSIGGYFLLESFDMLEIPLLSLAAGSYLIVVFHDLLPHSFGAALERGHYVKHIVFFLLGLSAMLALTIVLPRA